MARRDVIFVAALIAGTSYFWGFHLLPPGAALTAWKGAGVGLLALWAALNGARGIALVLALGALGDELIEAVGLGAGAIAFLAGHLVAIWFYRRHPRAALSPSQRALVWLLPGAVAFTGWALVPDSTLAWQVALYALALGGMAASAWASAFPRYWVGLGAMAFVASDLLLFARLGPLAGSVVPDWGVWPLYFGGQAMIAWGAVRTLGRAR
ncbi:MAG: lysoplasmalogenase [Sphingomonas sp.]|uniref:lysoplasmalogenase family protein n=1 Tax=Sphingomonas sp. TaxID=28214 RepID=UPI0025DA01B0|nr:lysoplasmalogenase family protein [Sphingomonas sp.]MBX9881932.1 lysoplasmalogenase [Sphingomonas sp.]